MADSMLNEEVVVYSEKHDIHGVIKDYGVVTKLFFEYDGKEIEMGIRRDFLWNEWENFEELGRNTIDSYVENLAAKEKGRKLQLHYWFIEEHERYGKKYIRGNGIVTGHALHGDSHELHTSPIQAMHVDDEAGELVLTTMNSVYHCPLDYCNFDRQDTMPNLIPDYDNLKQKYKDARQYPSIEPGNVLLVLSNFDNYYFNSLYFVPEKSKDGKPLKFNTWAHVGMFQDSFLIGTEDHEVDLRYFPHFQNIEFYMAKTDGCPLYIENIGDVVLYARTYEGVLKLNPGERKLVAKENAEDERPVLPDGDLYPAGIIE